MTGSADLAAAKADLRARLRAGRRAMSAQQIEASRTGVRAHVLAAMDTDTAAGRPWRRVFAYEPLPDEPGSVQLLTAMSERGASLLVPQLRPDHDLDWARWPVTTTSGGGALVVGAVSDAAASHAAASDAAACDATASGTTLVLVPALAVDRSGMRLGRGGGSYDRALSRLGKGTRVIALLHPREMLTFVPAEPWDQPVSAVVTANGWFDVAAPTDAI